MAYLLPAGTAPRSNTKLGLHLRGLGVAAAIMSNGGGPANLSPMYRLYNPPKPILPAPMPLYPGGGSVGIRPVQINIPSSPANPPLPMPVPLPVGPAPVVPAVTAPNSGTPVPSGYPVNQFFVAPDGSVWQFGGGKWFNTGTPNTVPGATPVPTLAPTPVTSGRGDGVAPAAPVSVTVAPTAAESGYQSILDWLTQQTLLPPVPNWITGTVLGFAAWKLFGSSSGGRR